MIEALALQAEELLIDCAFETAAVAAFLPENEEPQITSQSPAFTLSFVVRRGEEQASMIGNNGSRSVRMVGGQNDVSFIEITVAGTPTITTIDFDNGTPMPAVHSRHTKVRGLVPSQYYGTCSVK